MKMSNEGEIPPKYIEGDLMKKEDDKKWINYWVILRGKYLIFYTEKAPTSELREFFHGCIEINKNSKCITARRKKYSFPFYVITDKARYLFKTSSNLSRHQWFAAIEQASQGKLPGNIPNFLQPVNEHLNIEKPLHIPSNGYQPLDEAVSHTIEPVEKLANSINSDEYNDDDDDDDDVVESDNNISSKLFKVCSAPESVQTSRFLERNFSSHIQDNPSFEDDLTVTEMNESNPDKLAERLHMIYCQEEEMSSTRTKEIIPDVKEAAFSSPAKCPVQSFGYPTPSKYSSHLNPTSFNSLSRLTKSADSLRGMPLVTTNHSLSRAQNNTASSTLSNVNQNVSNRMLFSRHLISSAPDVKTK